MHQHRDNAGPPVGATFWDLILRIFRSPFLVIPIFLLIVAIFAAIGLGFIEVSWGDAGLKLSQGKRSMEAGDVNIAGSWRGEGKDLTDSDHKLLAKYTYTLSLNFTQKGADVDLQGSYFINEDKTLPQRTISGHGVIHADYLYLLYDIQVVQPPIAKTHGTMLFQVSPSSHAATGYYLTRSMANDGFVFGSLALSR
jgi:hypothetical protein